MRCTNGRKYARFNSWKLWSHQRHRSPGPGQSSTLNLCFRCVNLSKQIIALIIINSSSFHHQFIVIIIIIASSISQARSRIAEHEIVHSHLYPTSSHPDGMAPCRTICFHLSVSTTSALIAIVAILQ